MKSFNFIDKIQNQLFLHGGFSFNLTNGFNQEKKGYAIGGINKAIIVNSIEELKNHKNEIIDLLNSTSDNIVIGGWIDNNDNKVYIDLSNIVNNLDEALLLADKRKEIAIYDLKNDKEIVL